ncbi:MAG TPA: hypothetical protein VGG44_07485 [Tepidisphaeraceae bacterium]|jgi:hypothetical protein
MPKQTAVDSAKLIDLLTNLQQELGAKTKDAPALRVVEIKNGFSDQPEFLQLLMLGIAGPGHSFIRIGAGPEIGDIIAFAPTPEDLSKGIIILREITPKVFTLIERLRPARKKRARPQRENPASIAQNLDHQLAMVGPMICTLAEITKSNHPRARSLPKIITGTIVFQPEGYLEFPTEICIAREATSSDLWQQIESKLNQNQPTIRMLENPLLESASRIVKQMLTALKPAASSRKKSRTRS